MNRRTSMYTLNAITSLPLMGIWNRARPQDRRVQPALITPHGDLERRRRSACRRSDRPLITPHGDLEHVSGRDGMGIRSSHYPSWGSGTLASGSGRHDRVHLITPHGDLERRRPWPSVAPRSTSSLPLMGIWNHSTPRTASAQISSLPLMGIWNQATPPAPASPDAPHYPSWGSGTRASMRGRPARPPRSLPLMGIWNRRGVHRLDHPGSLLITPHGDLEPVRHSPSCAGRCSHYPSWGSGTGRSVTSDSGKTTSLPLMGIWNRRCAARRRPSLHPLITPHGDLEPGTAPRPPAQSAPLITPHGDLERGGALLIVARGRASLPLMGIWNRFGH